MPAPCAPASHWTRATIGRPRRSSRRDQPIIPSWPWRGQFALVHGDGPTAVRHFRAAYSALPDDRDTVFGLGTALALVGDHAAAAPFLRDAKAYDTLGGAL